MVHFVINLIYEKADNKNKVNLILEKKKRRDKLSRFLFKIDFYNAFNTSLTIPWEIFSRMYNKVQITNIVL